MNVTTCNVVTFTRSKTPIIYQYNTYWMDDEIINAPNSSVKDLGLAFDSKLNLKDHLDVICNGAMCFLGSVKKMTYKI